MANNYKPTNISYGLRLSPRIHVIYSVTAGETPLAKTEPVSGRLCESSLGQFHGDPSWVICQLFHMCRWVETRETTGKMMRNSGAWQINWGIQEYIMMICSGHVVNNQQYKICCSYIGHTRRIAISKRMRILSKWGLGDGSCHI